MTFGVYSGGVSLDRKKEWLEKAVAYPDGDFMTAG